jgi:hypothetical protein
VNSCILVVAVLALFKISIPSLRGICSRNRYLAENLTLEIKVLIIIERENIESQYMFNRNCKC